MEERNYFEMLGVEFDPPDNIKKIKAAFEEWKKRLTTEQNTTVDPQRLNEIREELSMSNSIATMIDNPNFRKMYADKLKEKRVEQLKNYISLLRGGSNDSGYTLQVTRAQMKKVSEKLHLSMSTVESTYRQEGFEIKNPRNKTSIIKMLNEFFISDNVMEDLRKHFDDFQTSTDFKRYPWASTVNDLYELAAKLDKSVKKPNSYRYLSADELSDIFRLEAQQIAEPIPIWHSIKSILNIAQMQIFDCNENRYRYDHSLNLEPEHTRKFFANLKSAPDIFKRDTYFADNCIDKIQESLPGVANKYELALALYNKIVGLLNDPYESPVNKNETDFYVFCDNCHSSTQFRTREEIERAKCPACGESFYMECPNCHKKILTTSEHCNYCKFPLEDMRNFSAYIRQANEMVAIVEEAQQNLGIEMQIVNVQKLMTKVFELVAKARIVNANDLRLKSLEDRINRLVKVQKHKELESWAKSKIPSLSMAPDQAVAECIEILNELQKSGVKNYRPVLDRLRLIKPKTPASITATIKEPSPSKAAKGAAITNKINVAGKAKPLEDIEEIKLTCTITWQPANDLGVKYQLVRKVNGVPQNNNDGEMLIDKTEKLEFEDKSIVTGISYGYAVFATRVGTVSNPATCEVVHYSDIEESKLIAKTEDGFCHFSWTLPSKNCLGVRILRTDSEGNLVVIADRVQSPFVDRAVRSKKQYYYRLQCVYYAVGERETMQEQQNFNDYMGYNEVRKINHKYEYSEGLTLKLMPESPPVALQNITYRVLNGRVIFNWRSTGEFSVFFREIKNNQLNIDSFKKMVNRIELNRLDSILGSNKVLAKADSRNQTCEFKLTEEFCKIAIISATQTLGVICDVVTIANVTPCTINMDKTSIDDGKLKIILNPLPDKLVKIHYAVTNKSMRGKLYMSIDEAKNNQMRFIFAKKYELDKVIIVHSPPQMELYLTVIGEYKMSDGSVVYSEPSTEIINNRPKSEILYWLEWGFSGILKKTARAKNCKLVLESKAGYTPTLYLAYNKNGGANIELDESSTVKISTIRESKEGLPNGHWEFLLDNAIWEGINEGTVIKLLPSKKDAKYFDIRPTKPDSLKVPPK